MKQLKYIALSLMTLGMVSCENDLVEDLRERNNPTTDPLPELTAGSADFSNYVSVGASFTAGFSDGGLFVAGQENSFPSILASKFANAGGGNFNQPLMDDNTGGILVNGDVAAGYRFVFGGAGPVPLNAFLASQGFPVPPITTEATASVAAQGPYNNMGIPGAKSFHLAFPGYAGLNPFYTRIATSPSATVIGDAVAQNPTFFTLSEVGGNDVLGYALSGGTGVDQTGNIDPSTYGGSDITDPNVFANTFNSLVNALTANGAKGVVTNVPYITDLAHFTTVPHNPLDPSNPSFGPQIPTLNAIFGALNPIFSAIDPNRIIVFSETEASAVVIRDESLTDISAQITGALNASPTFQPFLTSLGIPTSLAPVIADLLGETYGQTRQATAQDLLVLPSSSVIGTINTDRVAELMMDGLPQSLAGQFAVDGITNPLEDKWVLIPDEQMAIRTATDAYNTTITNVADTNADVALLDLNAILTEASTGIAFDEFMHNTNLVFGGLISLDGIHLTARGYAFMANKFLETIDANFGSNFEASGNFAKAIDYPTNYSASLQ